MSACALIKEYGSPREVISQGADVLENLERLRPEQARRLRSPNNAKAQEIMAICREFNWQILTPDHPCYPQALLELPDFPLVLFADGDLSLLSNPRKAAIVGTRRAGDDALNFAFRLAASLSENGVTVVSGCAVGIDSAAHEGALTGEGSTIGVLGNGFGFNYLPEQVFLRRRIRKYGLLLTETFPFEAPASYSFQRRNRLISGLSYSVTVAQSGKKGGSLITADYAERQGKRLFVPPQETVASAGCSALLQKGAKELKSAADAAPPLPDKRYVPPATPLWEPLPLAKCLRPGSLTLEEWALLNETTPAEAAAAYALLPKKAHAAPAEGSIREKEASELPDLFARAKQNEKKAAPKKPAATKKSERPVPAKPAESPEPPPEPDGLQPDELAVYRALGSTPTLLDELAGQLEMSSAALMLAVSMLELKGFVRTYPGNFASRV